MNDLVPDRPRIDRAALERIVRRAAELQTGERDIGEGLTEPELLDLGRDVGIPDRYLRQALVEERSRSAVLPDPGLAAWLAGPRSVAAQRSLPGNAERIRAALSHWMTDGELLTVKRRFPDRISWEPRSDVFSSLKRELHVGGRPYRLARAREIVGRVDALDNDRAHVQIVADLSNTRRSAIGGALTLAGTGAVATTIGLTLGVLLPVALIPVGLGLIAGAAVTKRRMSQVEEAQTSLEQVLDRLEHGEVVPPDASTKSPAGTVERIASEIRRNLGI